MTNPPDVLINLHLPPSIRDVVDSYIRTELLSKNPYFCDEDNARSLAAILWETLAAHGTDRDVAALIGISEVANSIEGGGAALRSSQRPARCARYAFGLGGSGRLRLRRESIGPPEDGLCGRMVLLVHVYVAEP